MAWEHYLFGKFVSANTPPTPEFVRGIISQGHALKQELFKKPLQSILAVLDRLSQVWADPQHPHYQRAMQYMPAIASFSPEMVELSLRELSRLCARTNLETIVRAELGDIALLDEFASASRLPQHKLCAYPLGVLLHVSPGNVFLGAADSLVRGFLTKNINLLKVASSDPIFPLLFAQCLQECDPDNVLAPYFAIINFRGGDSELEEEFKQRCNAIVVWGGQKALTAWHKGCDGTARLIPYGPRLSLALISSACLREASRSAEGLASLAKAMATDVVMWEQRGCGSPQALFLQESEHQAAFIEELQLALESFRFSLPMAPLSRDEQIEITRERELVRYSEIEGQGRAIFTPQRQDWSILVRRDISRLGSPLNRTLLVHPFSELTEVTACLAPYHAMLQSVGLGVSAEERPAIRKSLTACGVNRFTALGYMHRTTMGAPHDGSFQLERLVRWVCDEAPLEDAPNPADTSSARATSAHPVQAKDVQTATTSQAQPVNSSRTGPRSSSYRHGIVISGDPGYRHALEAEAVWQRIQYVVELAQQRSPYYARSFHNLTCRSWEEFKRLPFLDGDTLRRHNLPNSRDILTGSTEAAFIFASGGSTGEPKFSLYSNEEWQIISDILAFIYHEAGLRSQDRVANLFMAGNLYTSFLAVNDAIAKLGCTNLPIAGNSNMNQILQYIELFRPNVLVGMPSLLTQIGEQLVQRDIKLTIDKIYYGGEHFSPEAAKFMNDSFHTKVIRSAGYATVDAGTVGYQCPDCQGSVHHVLDWDVYVEIIDPESGAEVPFGQVGEIVVTSFYRQLLPIIRYRTGDLGCMVKKPCSCGCDSPRFTLKGRIGDVLRVGSVSVYPSNIASALNAFPGLSHLFQIVAKQGKHKDVLLVRTESMKEVTPEILAQMRQAIIDCDCELQDAMRESWLEEIEVEVLPPGGIPRIERTGKIRLAIDQRHSNS